MTGDVASATGVTIEPRECAAFAWRPWLLLGTLVVGGLPLLYDLLRKLDRVRIFEPPLSSVWVIG